MTTGTYAKLRSGEWGIRVVGRAKAGEVVAVAKKSGEHRQEAVQAVLWTDGQSSLCSIRHHDSSQHATSQHPASSKVCWECGRRFTWADAKRYGGDWSESYCGC